MGLFPAPLSFFNHVCLLGKVVEFSKKETFFFHVQASMSMHRVFLSEQALLFIFKLLHMIGEWQITCTLAGPLWIEG